MSLRKRRLFDSKSRFTNWLYAPSEALRVLEYCFKIYYDKTCRNSSSLQKGSAMQAFPMRTQTESGLYIVMRPLQEDEMASVSAAVSRYEVCKHLSLRGAQSPEQEVEWLRERYKEPNSHGWGICLAEDESDTRGRPIGTSGIMDIVDRRGESGVVLWDRDLWRQGIASVIHRARCYYAVQVLGLVAIDSGADQANHGSRKALEGVGYVKTGVVYNRGVAHGHMCHADQLLWVNPIDHVWNYFWGDSEAPEEFHLARKTAQDALNWAAEHVEFL